MYETIDKVPFTVLDNLVQRIKNQPVIKDRLDETEVSLEFVLGSLFPNVYDNVKDTIKDQYTAGYIAGLNGGMSCPIVPYRCPTCGKLWFMPVKLNKYACPYCGDTWITGNNDEN